MKPIATETTALHRIGRQQKAGAPTLPPSENPSSPEVNLEHLLKQFRLPARIGLWAAAHWLVRWSNDEATKDAFVSASTQLESGNLVVFDDHWNRSNILVSLLAVLSHVQGVQELFVPYAAHIDTGRDSQGNYSWPDKQKSLMFQWFRDRADPTAQDSIAFNPLNQSGGNSRHGDQSQDNHLQTGIYLLPVVRDYEQRVDSDIISLSHPRANRRYLQHLKKMGDNENGKVLLAASAAGLYKPDKSWLNPLLHDWLLKVQKNGQTFPFYLIGSYPRRWFTSFPYNHPLTYRHQVFLRGPFTFNSYEKDLATITDIQREFRQHNNFPAAFNFDKAQQK